MRSFTACCTFSNDFTSIVSQQLGRNRHTFGGMTRSPNCQC
jgi:hypothetical protein